MPLVAALFLLSSNSVALENSKARASGCFYTTYNERMEWGRSTKQFKNKNKNWSEDYKWVRERIRSFPDKEDDCRKNQLQKFDEIVLTGKKKELPSDELVALWASGAAYLHLGDLALSYLDQLKKTSKQSPNEDISMFMKIFWQSLDSAPTLAMVRSTAKVFAKRASQLNARGCKNTFRHLESLVKTIEAPPRPPVLVLARKKQTDECPALYPSDRRECFAGINLKREESDWMFIQSELSYAGQLAQMIAYVSKDCPDLILF